MKNISFKTFSTTMVLAALASSSFHAAFGKSKNIGDLRSAEAMSFGSFIERNVDVSAFPSPAKDPASTEDKTNLPVLKSATLNDLRGQQALSFGEFVRVKTASTPKLLVENKMLDESEPVPTPAPKAVPAFAVAPAAIQIAVVDKKGDVKQTTNIVQGYRGAAASDDSISLNKKVLRVELGDKVTFGIDELRFLSKEDSFSIVLIDKKSGEPAKKNAASIFVRDTTVAHFDEKEMNVRPKKDGSTELYIVHSGQAYFLPIQVEREFDAPKLVMNEDFFALEKQAKAPEQARLNKPSISEDQSDDMIATDIINDDVSGTDFVIEKSQINYQQMRVQFVDDRSDVARSKIYPIPHVDVRIVGTKFRRQTDGLGVVEIEDLPSVSRLLMKVEDPAGTYRPSVIELDTSKSSQTVTLLRNQALDVYENAINAPPVDSAATLCGSVRDASAGKAPLADLRISTDSEAIGPYFFNSYGLLDLKQRSTGPNGRFCFFQVEPGPVSIHFFAGEDFIATHLTAAFAGSHNWEDFYLYGETAVSTKLAMFANANEQLGSDQSLADSLKQVDMVDLIPLGRGESMTYTSPGVVEVVDGADLHLGRVFAVSQSSDFETALYPLAADRLQMDNVVSMFPRGFIDDMAVYAQVSYNPSLGVVAIEHNAFKGQDQGAEVKLLDENGHQVGDGWYYSDFPHTKAIFFNLNPGKYSLMVETKDGYWLAADTVYVFNETLSFIRTGSPLVLKTQN